MCEQPVDLVTVYSYMCWNEEAGQEVLMPTKATVDALVNMEQCTPVEGSGEQVPVALVDFQGLYRPDTSGRPDQEPLNKGD
jgi:hypothetical protein